MAAESFATPLQLPPNSLTFLKATVLVPRAATEPVLFCLPAYCCILLPAARERTTRASRWLLPPPPL